MKKKHQNSKKRVYLRSDTRCYNRKGKKLKSPLKIRPSPKRNTKKIDVRRKLHTSTGIYRMLDGSHVYTSSAGIGYVGIENDHKAIQRDHADFVRRNASTDEKNNEQRHLQRMMQERPQDFDAADIFMMERRLKNQLEWEEQMSGSPIRRGMR